ncbi:MAG: A24 family peptidase [Candidatus Phosphoribacter sp.]|nr:prepilin peptidase [Actinomycetales bacterium]
MTAANVVSGPWWLVAVCAAAAWPLGRWLGGVLAGGDYRLDDEQDHPVPGRQWLVTVGLIVVSALLARMVGWTAGGTLLPTFLLVGVVGVALAWIDSDVHRLPVGLTYPTAIGVVGLLAVAAATTGQWGSLGRALGVGVAAYVVLFILALVSGGQFGLGDVTLGAMLAVPLGYLDLRSPLWAIALAFILSGVWSVLGLITRKLTLRSHIAFGPFLLIGGLLATLAATR